MPRNIKVFLITEALAAGFGAFILPIYVLYFRYYQITLFEVALLAAVFEASVMLSEIPTGLFADRFGRKLSVGIGFALYSLSGLIFIVYRDLTGFIIAEILFGLAEAFISGAGEALAVDSIGQSEKEALLRKMYTLRSRIRISVTASIMIMAGYLFTQNVSITFYPVLAGGIAGLIVSLFFVPESSASSRDDRPRLSEPLKEMIRRIRLLPVLRIIFIMSLTANFAFEAADQYWQVLLSELFDFDVTYFGVLTASGAILSFILIGPFLRRFSGNISLPMFILLLSGVIVSSLPNVPAIALPLLLVLYFAGKELIRPLFSIAINRTIGSSGRATFLSGYNLTCSVGEVASGILAGIIASRLGLPVVFIICGSILVLVTIVVMFGSRSVFECGPAEKGIEKRQRNRF